MYGRRFYREWVTTTRLTSFTATYKKSDLYILAESDLSKDACARLKTLYTQIEDYLVQDPAFQKSLLPCPVRPDAPRIIQRMHHAALCAGVGPMASVAGAVAEELGGYLLRHSGEIIIENGGDLFISARHDITVGIYAGEKAGVREVRIKIKKPFMPCGVSTSSGSIGHSLSFGVADAVTIVARSAAVADAVATSVANKVKAESDIEGALRFAQTFDSVIGAVVIIGQKAGFCGTIELVSD